MQELGKFMSLVSDEKEKVTKIQEEKDIRFKPRVSVGQSLSDFFNLIGSKEIFTNFLNLISRLLFTSIFITHLSF